MKKIILITGGARSGKSRYAERIALSLSKNPVYVATAHVWDDEFRERVKKHQERRGPEWTNIEEEMLLSRHDLTGWARGRHRLCHTLVYQLLLPDAGGRSQP